MAAEAGDEPRRLQEQWLASLNHEVRTPLGGIVGMVDLLLETKLDAEQQDYVESTRQCAETLLATFNAMLEYSALSAGVVHADEVEFHLGAVLHELVNEYLAAAHAKGLRLVYRGGADVGRFVLGDQGRIRQIFSHILSNAIKFTHHGEIEVRADYAGEGSAGRLHVSIRDTGIGIAETDIPRIFACFSQVERGLSRSYAGLGLGLSLAKKLVGLLGGAISVVSQPECGSTFSFDLPLRNGAETPDWGSQPSATAQRPRRVLVVEDDRISQRIVSHLLRREAYEVDCVESGLRAVEAFRRSSYGLVLMDLQLPGMDGLETTQRIRELPDGTCVPILAFTANTSDDSKQRCLSAGMREFLSKPIQPDQLIEAVIRHLA